MVQFGRQLVLLLWLFLMFTFIVQLCHGSRTTNVFKIKPKSQYSTGHFLGFLPRHLPIPASGPSRKHNNLGLQSWRSPWRSLPLRSTINRAGKKKRWSWLWVFWLFSFGAFSFPFSIILLELMLEVGVLLYMELLDWSFLEALVSWLLFVRRKM